MNDLQALRLELESPQENRSLAIVEWKEKKADAKEDKQEEEDDTHGVTTTDTEGKAKATNSKHKKKDKGGVGNDVYPAGINHNPSPFRKTTSSAQLIIARTAEVKMMESEEGRGRVKVPVRNDARVTVAESSIQYLDMSGLEGEVVVEVVTTDWRDWEPVYREGEKVNPEIGGSRYTIATSVAEIASTAFTRPVTKAVKQVPQPKKIVPPMYRLSDVVAPAPKTGERPATAISSAAQAQRTPTGIRAIAAPGSSSAVAGIMKNIGKKKSRNQAAATRPNPKVISMASRPPVVPAAEKPPPPVHALTQPFRVSKPPQVSKNKGKIMPRNAFNNALPKPSVGLGEPLPPHLEIEQDFSEDLNEEEYAFRNPPELIEEPPVLSPPKLPVAASIPTKSQNGNGAKAGGKIGAPKSLSSNRFNTIDAKNKSAPTPAIKARNINSTKSSSNVTASKTNGKQSDVIAKKSAVKNKTFEDEAEEAFFRMKKHVVNMPGTDYDMPRIDDVSTYSTPAGVQVWVCLVCKEKEPEQSSREMICCDGCEDWYHFTCVGITQLIAEDEPWFCKRCIYLQSDNPEKDFPKLFRSSARR
ncbi:unnamed protein product [Orchesella dallaii]|uniref:PHD-type domain-containing protein n=1 Tax=Orchesella dallaii TaxID=48710 RepID=A0ABP1R8Q0_9HEXA